MLQPGRDAQVHSPVIAPPSAPGAKGRLEARRLRNSDRSQPSGTRPAGAHKTRNLKADADEESYSNLPPAAADSSSAQTRNNSSSASGAAAEDYSSSSDDGLGELTSEERLVLERRRHAELMLVAKFDKTSINPRRECWFLISARWMSDWSAYVERRWPDPPGPVSQLDLFADPEGKTLRADLAAKRDFRGIPPTLWYVFVELYGRDKGQELCRYTMNAYDPPLVGAHREQVCRPAQLVARVEVAKMRESFLPDSSSDESVDEDPICCCLYQTHVEFLLFHFFTCCKHLGKKGPRYEALGVGDYDASDDELGFESENDEDYSSEDDEATKEHKAARKAKEERRKQQRRDMEQAAKEKRRERAAAEEEKAKRFNAQLAAKSQSSRGGRGEVREIELV